MAIISNAVTIADAGAFSVSLGAMTHIKTLTASDSATLRFVHGSGGVDFSTYPIYKFEFINIHGSTDGEYTFGFQGSIDAGSFNTTSDIDAMSFEPGRVSESTVFQTGKVKMYGIKDS